jgi:hypothetical protein
MDESETGRPMPAAQAIHWKPLRDAHYIMASLQPADGGRRRIFIRQKVLSRVNELAVASHGRKAFGLLLGQLYECSVTGASYLVVESLAEQPPVSEEADIAQGVRAKAVRVADGDVTRSLGWYRTVPRLEQKPPDSAAAIHASVFEHPWQMMLLIAEGPARPTGGAVFLHDSENARWFSAPFYELPDRAPNEGQPKRTCIAWPQYMTVDTVVYHEGASPETQPADIHGPTVEATKSRASEQYPRQRPSAAANVALSPQSPDPPAGPYIAPPTASADDVGGLRIPGDGPLRSTPVQPLVDISEKRREKLRARHADTAVAGLTPVDETHQRSTADAGMRYVSDTDDTSSGDDPPRYIELARAEGFVVAAKFDSVNQSAKAETLWVLNEPNTGILLTVVVAGARIVAWMKSTCCRLPSRSIGMSPHASSTSRRRA